VSDSVSESPTDSVSLRDSDCECGCDVTCESGRGCEGDWVTLGVNWMSVNQWFSHWRLSQWRIVWLMVKLAWLSESVSDLTDTESDSSLSLSDSLTHSLNLSVYDTDYYCYCISNNTYLLI